MALNINFCIIGGRVGKNPELRYTKTGTAVAEVSLATNDPSNTDNTLWHNLVIWGKNAENTCKFIKKGSEVLIEGYNKPEKYTAKDGTKKNKHSINVNKITFMGVNKIEIDQPEETEIKFEYSVDEIPF